MHVDNLITMNLGKIVTIKGCTILVMVKSMLKKI